MKKLIKLYPKNASALNFLGYLYADLGINLNESYNLISKALEFNPENYAFIDSMAWVLYKQGKYKRAYEYQIKALKKNPKEKEIIKHMKEILKALGLKKNS